MRNVRSEGMYVIEAIAPSKWTTFPVAIPPEYQALKWDGSRHEGQWMRTPNDDINLHHLFVISRPGTTLDYDGFRDLVPRVDDPGNQIGLLVSVLHLTPVGCQLPQGEFGGQLVQVHVDLLIPMTGVACCLNNVVGVTGRWSGNVGCQPGSAVSARLWWAFKVDSEPYSLSPWNNSSTVSADTSPTLVIRLVPLHSPSCAAWSSDQVAYPTALLQSTTIAFLHSLMKIVWLQTPAKETRAWDYSKTSVNVRFNVHQGSEFRPLLM